MNNEKAIKCFVSHRELSENEAVSCYLIKDNVYDLLKKDFPSIERNNYISIDVLNDYRRKYLQRIIVEESGQLNILEAEVLQSIANNKIIAENVDVESVEELSLGQRMADKIAEFGGSWYFILSFFFFILVWIASNVFVFTHEEFDPYPFILLNLILSCIAALQAPIIMMSQNRQDEKDRKRSQQDYKVNLKAELEIKLLHEKIDHLIKEQNKRLLEIQELQADYLEDILKLIKK